MEAPPTNNTMEKISNDGLRHTWASYFLFIVMSSVIGDSTILIATIRYRAFKLHKLSVGVIQHIAACDIMVSVCLIPRIVALVADGWVVDEWMCYLSAYSLYYFMTSSSFLISMMTASKLFIVKFPMRAMTFRNIRVHVWCAIIWAFVMVLPVTFLIVGGVDVLFSFKLYNCDFNVTKDGWSAWGWLEPLLTVVFVLFPNVLVLVCTALLIKEATNITRRSAVRTTLKWQGLTTTILIATAYCISLLPYCIYRLLAPHVPDSLGSVFHHQFMRFAKSILYLNTISNFYIYCLTVTSFREFLLKKINVSCQNLTITPRKG